MSFEQLDGIPFDSIDEAISELIKRKNVDF